MIGINFDKAQADSFVTSLASGTPIAHEGGWTADELIMLAGACFFAVLSQGPTTAKIARLQGMELEEPHPEHAEARDDLLVADILGAIAFTGELTGCVHDKEYDGLYAPVVRAMLRGDTKEILPLEGFF